MFEKEFVVSFNSLQVKNGFQSVVVRCLSSHLLVHVVKKLLPHKSWTSDDDSLHYVKVDMPQYILDNLT